MDKTSPVADTTTFSLASTTDGAVAAILKLVNVAIDNPDHSSPTLAKFSWCQAPFG